MHHSTPGVQNRAVHDFGGNLVGNCKVELIQHFSNRDIDDVADLILAKASNAFLDKALEMRLATIDAKPLLHALARAERLGYDSQDLVDVSHGEHVIPNSHMSRMPASGPGVAAPGPVDRTNGNRAAQPNELQCMRCYRTFNKRSYFDYVSISCRRPSHAQILTISAHVTKCLCQTTANGRWLQVLVYKMRSRIHPSWRPYLRKC